MVAVSSQNREWGKGGPKPYTNLRSGTTQVKIITEFSASRKIPYTCLSHLALCRRDTMGPFSFFPDKASLCHMTAQLRTTFLSFLCGRCGHVTGLWSVRGDRFHPSKIVAVLPGLGVPGRGTCLYTEQLDDSVTMGAPF